MRSHLRSIGDQLLYDVEKARRMDVIRDLAYPLPAMVIAEMVVVPPEDRDRFRNWTDHLAAFRGGICNLTEIVGGAVHPTCWSTSTGFWPVPTT